MRHLTLSQSLLLFAAASFSSFSIAALKVTPLADETSASLQALVETIVGPNINIIEGSAKLVYVQDVRQIGAFSGGRELEISTNEGRSIGVPSGIVLSTGYAVDAEAGDQFTETKKSTDLDGPDGFTGDNPLDEGNSDSFKKDMVYLEFDVRPLNDKLRVDFVFASEEYEDEPGRNNDRVCPSSDTNDRFGIFVSGAGVAGEKNLAVWSDGVRINTDSLHNRDGWGCPPTNNWAYIANPPEGLSNYKTSLDGFSVPLAGQVDVTAGEVYTVKIVISDSGDALYDSAVFVRFVSSPGEEVASVPFYPFGSRGILSTKTPISTVVSKIADENGPIDKINLSSGLPPTGVSLAPFSGDAFVFNAPEEGTWNFELEAFDYLAWRPCGVVSDHNPCDYGSLSEGNGNSNFLDFELTFASADVDVSEISVSNSTLSISDAATISVVLKDENGNPIVSGGDTVAATSTLGELNGQSATEVSAVDLGNGQYQFLLTSSQEGQADVTVTLNGVEMGESPISARFSAGPDSDNDGLSDNLELRLGTSPNNPDSDGDGVPDGVEIGDLDNPRNTDGDALIDALDPDDDNDGLLTKTEGRSDNDLDYIPNYLDAVVDEVDLSGDADGDGITNEAENPGLESGEESLIDTDGDFLPNAIDEDSDNDGKPDSEEWPPGRADADLSLDGDIINDYADADDTGVGPGDSDGDTVPDNVECGLPDSLADIDILGVARSWYFCSDSDADGQPDYMENDSDNDGLPDQLEAGADPLNPVDSDRDGRPDYRDTDSDNDSIPDQLEAGADPLNPVDTDQDGSPDYRDTDSDNDGWSDSKECPAPDNCADLDGNGIPDYRDRARDLGDGESPGVIKTQTDGVGGMGAFAIALFSFLLTFRLRSINSGFFLLGAPLLLSVNVYDANAQSGSFYGGFNLGLSALDPDTSGAPALTIDQDMDVALKLDLGYDLNEHFSIEGFWANLGETTFKPNGELSYEALGLGVNAYYFYMGEARSYGSGAVYLKGGFVSLLNSGSGVEFENSNSLSLYVGAGTEYWLNDSWSVRLAMTTYDKDAAEASVGVAYRFSAITTRELPEERARLPFSERLLKAFAGSSEQTSEQAESNKLQTEVEGVLQEPVVVPLTTVKDQKTGDGPKREAAQDVQGVSGEEGAITTVPQPQSVKEAKSKVVDDNGPPQKQAILDEDQDGVADQDDKCPYTPKGIKVGEDGCAVYQGIWREMR